MSDRNSTAAAPTRPLMPNGEPLPQDFDEKLIHTVVHAFYDKVRRDELLGPVFNSRIPADQWPTHLNRMCDFWSSSFLRTDRYDGRPLPPHLGIAELSDAHFERWLELFHQTVNECCSPASARGFYDLARRVAHSFRLAVAFHRGEDTVGIVPFPAR